MHVKNRNDVLPMFEYFSDIVPEPIYCLDLEQRVLGFSRNAVKS